MRSFLFVQGIASRFFRRFGEELVARGHKVTRVNICGGDRIFWGRDDWNAVDFQERPDGLKSFILDLIKQHDVSDLVFFSDCRPAHRAAIAAAKWTGTAVWVFEEGYFRPHWITMERDGVNAFSRLPDDPKWYIENAHRFSPEGSPYRVGGGLRERILMDFRWQAANYTHALRYPHYRTHRPYPIWAEYATWTTRLAVLRYRQQRAETFTRDLLESGTSFHLFPLQLNSDSQVRIHSPFHGMDTAIEAVISNFATWAPKDQHLVIKNHPLDNAWINYPRLIARLVRDCDISDRVHFIDGGNLLTLIDHAIGTVTVNSTVGLTALERGGSTICLGRAVYNIPGLTFDGLPADFWKSPPPPDKQLLKAFRRVTLAVSVINGNFYTDEGVSLAVEECARRITGGTDLLRLAGAPSPNRQVNFP